MAEINHPDTFTEGVLTRSYQTRLTYRYLLKLPEGYDAPAHRDRRWPLVLSLHGGAEVTPQMLRHETASIAARPVILVAPICPPAAEGVDPRHVDWDARLLGELVRLASQTYRVDPARRSVVGFSMGGSAAWELPFREPDLFTKVVAMAGVCHPWSLRHYPPVAVWAFIGEHDFMREAQEHTVHMARRFGVDVVATLLPDADHSAVHRRTRTCDAMLAWLTSDADLRRATQIRCQDDLS